MSGAVIVIFLVFGLLGMPLAFALGLAAAGRLYYGGMEFVVLPQRMMHAIDSFPLMAIPLFMLAGELMVAGDIMGRLVTFANAIIGRVHGGLAHVTIITGAILAAVSGAAVASASALGTSLIPVLRKQYDDGYSSAIIASAANLGPIIPPSGAMIVYALMAGSSVSVGGMFMAGVVPGILLTVTFMLAASWIARRRNYPLTGEPFEARRAFRETRRAFVIFMMPIIVVGGIVGGVFTPTEGAGILPGVILAALFMGIVIICSCLDHSIAGRRERIAPWPERRRRLVDLLPPLGIFSWSWAASIRAGRRRPRRRVSARWPR